jgi:hypothetical protein
MLSPGFAEKRNKKWDSMREGRWGNEKFFCFCFNMGS